ncbi:hypothetical protein Tco_0720729, partial [Tanacetum coccineum]
MAYLHPHLPYLPLDQNGKIFNLCTDSVYFTDITSLPPRAQRHPWLRYQVKGYTKEIIHDFEQKVGTIFGRQINRVHVLDFAGLTVEMMQTLANRFILEFFSTCRMSDIEMGLDVADTLCFQLGGA